VRTGSLAALAAIRRASSFMSSLAGDRRPLLLIVDVGELLPTTVLHDEACAIILD
jgi:hypothetical protein